MPNLNQVNLMGNVVRDPEVRVTPKGTSICQFSIAVNRTWKGDDGQKKTEVSYFDCECWGRGGEVIAKYVTKGKPLFVSGRLRQDNWVEKDTDKKRSKIKIVVEDFQLLGGGQSDPSEKPQGDQDRSSSSKPATPQENLDDSIPF